MDEAGRRDARRVIAAMEAGGNTNLSEGWFQAVIAATESPSRTGRATRIVILSDGHANAGVVGTGELARHAQELLARGVTTSALGIGDGYDEQLLGAMAEAGGGSITAFYTVLVEGDDHNEPVADAVRGILDGHIVMERAIAERGRYPAVDVLRSLSRTVPGCLSPWEREVVGRARRVLSVQAEMADLVRLGAYRAGTDPAVDEALRLAPRIEAVLAQRKGERGTIEGAFAALADAMAEEDGGDAGA